MRARPDRATSFQETSRLVREAQIDSTFEATVRSFRGSDWISISGAVADPVLEAVSRILGTVAIGIYATDEVLLTFSYRRYEEGRLVRAVDYEDDGNPGEHAKWTRVEGEPEPWEAILFSSRLMALYRKHAAQEVDEACAEARIKPGFSVPWACDAETIAQIARDLQLPWDPVAWPVDGEFPPATQIEVIPGRSGAISKG